MVQHWSLAVAHTTTTADGCVVHYQAVVIVLTSFYLLCDLVLMGKFSLSSY